MRRNHLWEQGGRGRDEAQGVLPPNGSRVESIDVLPETSPILVWEHILEVHLQGRTLTLGGSARHSSCHGCGGVQSYIGRGPDRDARGGGVGLRGWVIRPRE